MKKAILFLALAGAATAQAQNVGIGTIAPTDQLHTTGTVRFQNYSGIGSRILYLDSAGRIAPPPPGNLYSNTTRYSIPDNGCASNTGASGAITVSGLPVSLPSSQVSIRVNITHTYLADLRVFLFSPSGKILKIIAAQGGSNQNLPGAIFTDEAPGTLAGTPPYAARYKPLGNVASECAIAPTAVSFADLGTGGNINPNGTWTLKVFDNDASDTGSLQSWQISFEGQNAFGTTGATGPVAYFNGGALALSSITNSPAGNVGIGNPAPTAKLDIAGSLRIANGSQGAGKVLVSDATGLGTWQLPVASGTGFLAGLTSNVALTSSGFTPAFIPFTVTTTSGSLPFFDDVGNFGTPTAGAFTAPTTGVYHFDAGVSLPGGTAASATNWALVASLNGVSIHQSQRPTASGGTLPGVIQYSFTCKMTAGSTLRMGLITLGTTNVQINSSSDTYFSGYRVY